MTTRAEAPEFQHQRVLWLAERIFELLVEQELNRDEARMVLRVVRGLLEIAPYTGDEPLKVLESAPVSPPSGPISTSSA